ncbi:MAG: dihydrofolate reductase [Pirellulaceae bacterium]
MRISIIVAVSQNGVIGRDGDLPWRLSSDLRRFKQLTMGGCLVMGRRTFDSIGRVLPGRTSVVLTRGELPEMEGRLVVHSLDEALASCTGEEAFIIGGGDVYRQALPRADRLYLTTVHADIEGDVRFPEVDQSQWRLVEETFCAAGEKDQHDSTFRVLDRIRTSSD